MNNAILDRINSIFVRDRIMTVISTDTIHNGQTNIKRSMRPRCTITVISKHSTVLQAEDVREADVRF